MFMRQRIFSEVSAASPSPSCLLGTPSHTRRSRPSSDVLLRHIRSCDEAQKTLDREASPAQKQSRTKKACNRCAKSKMRCDSQQPCQRCKQKSLSCEYTRTGYSDPYGLFQLKDTAVAPPSIQSTQLPQQYMDRFVDFNASEIHTAREQYPSAQQLSSSEPVNTGKHPQLELAPSDVSISTDCLDTFTMPPYTSVGLEVPLEDLGWEQFLNMPGNRDFSPFSLTCSVQGDVVDVFAQRAPEPGLGFTLQQIDPIEAKCIEIRKYLDNIRPDLAPDPVSTYLTRDRLVEGIELYGKYFQPVVPVLHVPTFELVKAPPVLLLTMMLVGRCYSRVGVSAANIQQWAIHLLLTIESSMVSRPPNHPYRSRLGLTRYCPARQSDGPPTTGRHSSILFTKPCARLHTESHSPQVCRHASSTDFLGECCGCP